MMTDRRSRSHTWPAGWAMAPSEHRATTLRRRCCRSPRPRSAAGWPAGCDPDEPGSSWSRVADCGRDGVRRSDVCRWVWIRSDPAKLDGPARAGSDTGSVGSARGVAVGSRDTGGSERRSRRDPGARRRPDRPRPLVPRRALSTVSTTFVMPIPHMWTKDVASGPPSPAGSNLYVFDNGRVVVSLGDREGTIGWWTCRSYRELVAQRTIADLEASVREGCPTLGTSTATTLDGHPARWMPTAMTGASFSAFTRDDRS